jgi:hypothetical protein
MQRSARLYSRNFFISVGIGVLEVKAWNTIHDSPILLKFHISTLFLYPMSIGFQNINTCTGSDQLRKLFIAYSVKMGSCFIQ